MPKAQSKSAAWHERAARRAAGDPTTADDHLFHKARANNYVDKYGTRYSLPRSLEAGMMAEVVYTLPSDEQRVVGCDGCRMVHNAGNPGCSANGGPRVVERALRFASASDGAALTLVPLSRKPSREAHIIYKVRVLYFRTTGKRRAGRAKIRVTSLGQRIYKRAHRKIQTKDTNNNVGGI